MIHSMIHSLIRATGLNIQCAPVYHTGPTLLVDVFVVFLSRSIKMTGFYLKLVKTLTFHINLT